MTIDAELAWNALLRARARWRPGVALEPVRMPDDGTGQLEVSPDGTWRAIHGR